MIIWAHRGASGYTTDNTLKSFNLAIKMGTKALESDVKLTGDGRLVFLHDSTIKLFNRIPIPVLVVPFPILASRNKEGFERIPLVKEIFRYYEQKGILHDIKWSIDVPETHCFKKLAKLSRKFEIEENVYACNSGFRYFRKWKEVNPRIKLVWSIREKLMRKLTIRGMIKTAKKLDVSVINLKASEVTPEIVGKVRGAGITLYIWDLHDKARYQAVLEYSPDGIYTNYPDKVINGEWIK
ncbi:MAG: glycerophosphodiester phosphodiesterase [Candidatus Hodarchaeota archaeon]